MDRWDQRRRIPLRSVDNGRASLCVGSRHIFPARQRVQPVSTVLVSQVHLGQLACVRLVTIAWHVIDLNVRYANAGTIATPLKLHP